MEKILSISLELNFIPNTSGCFGLMPQKSKKRGLVTLHFVIAIFVNIMRVTTFNRVGLG